MKMWKVYNYNNNDNDNNHDRQQTNFEQESLLEPQALFSYMGHPY